MIILSLTDKECQDCSFRIIRVDGTAIIMAAKFTLPLLPSKKMRGMTFSVVGRNEEAQAQTSLRSPDYCSRILAGLNDLRQSGLLCDYTLSTDGQTLNVHRAVMVACSDYFHAMLTSDMIESRESQVLLKGISCVGLQAVVDFAYTGTLAVTLDNLQDVLAGVSHLQVSEAMDLCCRFMEQSLTIDNCVDMLHLADLYSLHDSRSVTRNFILQNFESLAETDNFCRLSCEQLASLIAENRLKVVSEYKLFELVLRWVKFNPEEREEMMPILVSSLRLPLLSGEELVDKVSQVSIMHSNRECSRLLMDAKDYHIVVSKQPLLQSERTQVRAHKHSLAMCHAENLENYDFETERHAFLKDAMVPLYNPCVVVVENFMYACGGKYDSNENNEIATARCFRYDPRFDTWFELPSMNEARKDFVMVGHNGSLYSIGGQDENMVMSTMECFSIVKNDWENGAALPHAIYTHAGTVCGERVYITGGQKFDGHCRSMMSYDIESDQWRDEPHLINIRSNHNMAAIGGCLYVLGGNTEDPYGFPVPVTSIERFDPGTSMWTVLKSVMNIREAGMAVLNEKIYIVGGINGQHYFSDLIQSFDADNDRVEIITKFSSRIYGRACCVMKLPQYV